MQEEYLYAEMFIDVDPIFSRLLNAHLQRFLELFDNTFKQNGGMLMSMAHMFERYVVARSVCEASARIIQNEGLSLTWLKTQTEFYSSSVSKPITILTRSFFLIPSDPKSPYTEIIPN